MCESLQDLQRPDRTSTKHRRGRLAFEQLEQGVGISFRKREIALVVSARRWEEVVGRGAIAACLMEVTGGLPRYMIQRRDDARQEGDSVMTYRVTRFYARRASSLSAPQTSRIHKLRDNARQPREERDLRASYISLVSHMSCIPTSLLSIQKGCFPQIGASYLTYISKLVIITNRTHYANYFFPRLS